MDWVTQMTWNPYSLAGCIVSQAKPAKPVLFKKPTPSQINLIKNVKQNHFLLLKAVLSDLILTLVLSCWESIARARESFIIGAMDWREGESNSMFHRS